MKWFENIFTKSKRMIISGIFSTVGYFALACISLITSANLIEPYLILAALSGLLLVCYKKGETSCQKALIGAILGVLMYAYWGIMAGFLGAEKECHRLSGIIYDHCSDHPVCQSSSFASGS